MTTYTLEGIYVRYDQLDAVDTFLPAAFNLSAEPGVTSFSYFYDGLNDDDQPTIDINGLYETLWPRISGGPNNVDLGQIEAQIIDIGWTYDGASGGSVVLVIDDLRPDFGEYYFIIGGDPLPPSIDTPSEWDDFNASLGTVGSIDFTASSPFAAGDSILLATLTGVSQTENDTIFGTPESDDIDGGIGLDLLIGNGGDDTLRGGAGGDTLIGGNGRDNLRGGDGNDLLDGSGGSAGTQGFGDFFEPGLGRDTILGHAAHWDTGEGGDIFYGDVSGVGGLTINSGTNGSGTVKSGDGRVNDSFTYIHYFIGSMDGDLIQGSNEDRFEGYQGLGGNDTIHGGAGFDGLDYWDTHFSGGTTGIVADFGAGTVSDDGLGGSDSFTGIERLRGTIFGDLMVMGSNTIDRIRLEGHDGDDTLLGGNARDILNGGGGNDRIDASAGSAVGQGFGDIVLPGSGMNTIIGHQAAWEAGFGGGVDLIYENLQGSGGIVVTIGPNGSGTAVSNVVGVLNDSFTYVDHIEGTQEADSFVGSAAGESFVGEDGADTIDGNGGWDTVQYWLASTQGGVSVNLNFNRATDAAGDIDRLFDIEAVEGTDFDDSVVGDDQNNYLAGRAGEDQIYGLGGGDDISAGDGDDTVYGGDGDDTIRDGQGDDELRGGNQNDLFVMGTGFDTFIGGAGTDTVLVDLTGGAQQSFGVFADLATGIGYGTDPVTGDPLPFGQDAFDGIENYTLLGDFDAELIGSDVDNVLRSDLGEDRLTGAGGDDLLDGGAGNDSLFGNTGNDTLLGGDGDDRLDGGNGDDSVIGADGADTIFGGKGYDTLRGGDGNDRVVGGDGRDLAYLGGGDDLFFDNAQGGVNGRDTVWANAGNDTVQGGNGDDVFYGEGGADLILGRLGNDRLFGGDQNDTLRGGDGNDVVAGGNGRDRAFLGAGNDQWFDNDQVQFGDDFIDGWTGDDTIRMGGGNDTAVGGDGADVFVFAAGIDADVIRDYQLGQDALEIDTGLWGGALDQARLEALTDTSSGTLVLDFGGGHSITFEGLTSNAGLLDDIVLV
ncbi:calcium-binding protein [Thetidibacter halocola]|uniref:Calcium-binding protein n=1 Tax=Thetidibacter halocola TaxID=2827239 RepID=A0A8J8B7X6_9RHOB|nr:calcium-binding protein [Thetidibacter halocola]MBS0124174.1 hypothetical protein [Thetidibacter halocola]